MLSTLSGPFQDDVLQDLDPRNPDYFTDSELGFLPLLLGAAPAVSGIVSSIGGLLGGGKSKAKKEKEKAKRKEAEAQALALQQKIAQLEMEKQKGKPNLLLYGGLGAAGLVVMFVLLRGKKRR